MEINDKSHEMKKLTSCVIELPSDDIEILEAEIPSRKR